ncbi:MAG: secretin and TonB N-terminal domain-containing protein, partial [Deltaproteobacteria bacterium]|nr:secretin and TonB N-terminal domain-containing protein [Deltaproteobacteria bacterium]
MSILGKLLTIFSALILVWGCSAKVSRNGPTATALAPLPQAAERTMESSPPKPPPVRSLLVTTIDEKLPEPKELISFALKDADVKDVLMGLSRMSRYNIVFEQDISGKLSVDLKEVTLEEALKLLLPPMGLEFKRDGRMIQVSKPKVETRIFTLNYVSTTRKGKNQIQAASGSGGAAATTPGVAPAAASGAGGAGDTSQVESSDQIDQWEEIKQGLTGLVSKEGKFSINRWAGLISVTDFSPNLLKIATYLEAVEGSAQRQVVIEAEVLELSQTEDFEFGIDWVGGSRANPNDIKHKIQGGVGFADALTRAGIISQHLNPRSGIINIGLADERLTFLLDLLQKEGKLKVLSRPSVSTLNNQKAIIKV